MEKTPNKTDPSPHSPKPLISCTLKRRRPPSLDIPRVLKELMPITQCELSSIDNPKEKGTVCFTGPGVGLSAVKGNKKSMEDTHKIVPCLNGNPNEGFFGVYDGHGGRNAAEFVAENLHTNIVEMMGGGRGECGRAMSKEEAVKAGYLKTDQDFLKQGLVSGACCVTALIEGQEVVVSNVGDCRAVLCRGGVAEVLTKDHRAEREDERERIENKGGYVEIHRGAWRVHGVLSVTRSIGDSHLKDWVLAEPETKILPLTPDMEFLILASDGLWEKVRSQEAIDIVASCMPDKTCRLAKEVQWHGDVNYGCINASPSLKLPRIAVIKKGLRQSPMSNKTTHGWNDTEDDIQSENQSPALESRKISLVKRININCQSRTNENSDPKKRPGDSWNDTDDYFPCENHSPPLKLRRISLVKRININWESSVNENSDPKKRPATMGLAAASKELVNLAVGRGSLDDVTVMIIDLSHFQRDVAIVS